MKGIAHEIISAAKQAPVIYFAPLVGAIREVKALWKRLQASQQA
ncbi:hypothetical protein ACAW63_15750 [Pseudomonas sp. QE6]|nr:hypothetical protein [Pseudomonas aeruginosa]